MAAEKGFMGAMKEFFGLNTVTDEDGTVRKQRLPEFMAEVKELSHPEKLEFHEMLVGVGAAGKPPIEPGA